ncbi:DUF222 domain-containing protein [Mycolicibacterium sp. BiH015]|uniref:HNH endonuclease signature motif containing protein n=1 Tax=Mycolicibacterium sp. BiH015 TaxID=3018808 RepID=UPI0022DFF513|nr:HNH endonuclease signature motif containing protein [Mycolicibacterium sp. BiH015]MDA2890921.1 DUF222 domain-containing protein [Mycolicibacterium sp. BiH015]
MFDELLAAVSAARTPGHGVRACARLENAACAARLGHMADMLDAAYRASGSAGRDQWRCDNWSAVCAQIGAAHEVTSGVASGLLTDAVALRERLPRVAAVFAEGLISYRLVHTICTRTMLVKDPDALREIDAELANALLTWGAKSREKSEKDVDELVLRHDRYAQRRTELACRGAHLDVQTDSANGVCYVTATVLAPDGEAVDKRADALARTVCDRDPRTLDQRRAAALSAMAYGWDRLPCLCESNGCEAAARPAGGGVVIHVIARQDIVDQDIVDAARPAAGVPEDRDCAATEQPQPTVGDLSAQRRALTGENSPLLPKPWQSYTLRGLLDELAADPGELCAAGPATILGGAVLPAPVAAQVALHATIKALIHPGQAPPEPRYRPSRTLAEFIRCRDQTCRFPGCSRPATITDIDHTIPYPVGPTCASNLACLCREHHLLKTFWPGWSSVQYPDGSIVWTDPDGCTATTYPGSRTLFPELCTPTAEVAVTASPRKHIEGLTMPKRTITRAEARKQRIDDERRRNESGNGQPAPPDWAARR